MSQARTSPRVAFVSWGRLELEDGRSFKDAKLFPGGAREWNWRETGTHHVPGIQPVDVEELLSNGAEAVVLSRGMWKRLQICPETTDVLESRGVCFYVHQTEEAVRVYNELQRSIPVGGLFHSTC
jgi:hypothetical protein